MFTLASRGATKRYPLENEQQRRGAAQVVHTHRTSCWHCWPRGLGGLNSSPNSKIFTSVSVGSSPRSYLFTSASDVFRTKVWHKTYPIYHAPLSRSAGRNFAPSQKPGRHNRSYVWTETLSGKIFVTVQKLSGIVWTCLKSTVFRKVTLLLTTLLVLERSCKQFWSERDSKSTLVRAVTLLLTADPHSCSRTFVGTILQ